jgi:hypothetical protein
MTSALSTPCREHSWERHLQVYQGLERVVRVCAACGREEICWARPRPRRTYKPRESALVVSNATSPEFDPEISI